MKSPCCSAPVKKYRRYDGKLFYYCTNCGFDFKFILEKKCKEIKAHWKQLQDKNDERMKRPYEWGSVLIGLGGILIIVGFVLFIW